MPRRYSDWEISDHTEREQRRRAAAREASAEWAMVPDDLSEAIGGGVWRRVEGD